MALETMMISISGSPSSQILVMGLQPARVVAVYQELLEFRGRFKSEQYARRACNSIAGFEDLGRDIAYVKDANYEEPIFVYMSESGVLPMLLHRFRRKSSTSAGPYPLDIEIKISRPVDADLDGRRSLDNGSHSSGARNGHISCTGYDEVVTAMGPQVRCQDRALALALHLGSDEQTR